MYVDSYIFLFDFGVSVMSGVRDWMRYLTWNIGMMLGKAPEVVMAIGRRIDVCCVQETKRQWHKPKYATVSDQLTNSINVT